MHKKIFTTLLAFSISFLAFGQQEELQSTTLPLNDLSSFKPVASNWKIEGETYTELNQMQTLKNKSGKGVLLNQPTEKAKDNIFTQLEHGDMELELEFMVPKGSNSGVYLQGRYEVQIFDSWNVTNPTYSDNGGIYQRWDESRPQGKPGFEGHPPRLNASRAPGLWQHFKIFFRAPRFDAAGKKIENAKFVQVVHNGVVVHENIEVSGPTRAAAFTDEKPMGPLMIQGDHGPVAIRNIKYKLFGKDRITLKDIKYSFYEGKFNKLVDAKTVKPVVNNAPIQGLTWNIGNGNDAFLYRFSGMMEVPKSGTYRFDMVANGGGELLIDGKTVINHDGWHDVREKPTSKVELQKGTYPFTVSYFKNNSWMPTTFSIFAEGPEIERHALHAESSAPAPEPVGEILVTPDKKPLVLRSFLEHNGKKRTHSILVGEPAGLNYALDLQQGSLLKIWRGGFVDATEMWHERGEAQLAEPEGVVIQFEGAPQLTSLKDKNAAWPDSVDTENGTFKFKKYVLDQQGRPTFHYTFGQATVTDQFQPDNNNQVLTRQINVSAPENTEGLYWRIAEGKTIKELKDGAFLIDDMQYYIKLNDAKKVKPIVRNSKNGKEILVPVSLKDKQASLSYSIIW